MKRIPAWAAAAVLGLWAGSVCGGNANPLLLAPTGATLTTGQLRAEAAFSANSRYGSYYWLATGLQQYEINLTRVNSPTATDENLVGLQWSFLPETMLTPAISLGVRDVASQSEEGMGIYVAITRHLPLGAASRFLRDVSVTAGIGALGIKGPFLGGEARLPLGIFAQVEYDSHDLNGAVGWQPTELFRVKAYTIRKDFFVGAELVPVQF